MAARTKKSNTTEATPTDLVPVELDPIDPALARWEALADRDRMIHHGGDIEKVMPFPRPAWSDPDEDLFATSMPCMLYRAYPAKVSATRHTGDAADPEFWTPAGIFVQPAIGGTDVPVVRVSFSEKAEKGWHNGPYMALTITEAHDLIEVLKAAVDLFGGDQ